MPYVNPKGALSHSAPPRGTSHISIPSSTPASEKSKTPSEPVDGEKKHYLDEEQDTRPMDPKVVDELDHWHGFQEERHSPDEEPDVDPMDEAGSTSDAKESKGKAEEAS